MLAVAPVPRKPSALKAQAVVAPDDDLDGSDPLPRLEGGLQKAPPKPRKRAKPDATNAALEVHPP